LQSSKPGRNSSQRLEQRPGRYVGLDTATDDDFDYEERLAEINFELEGLNEEAIALANTIVENFKEIVL